MAKAHPRTPGGFTARFYPEYRLFALALLVVAGYGLALDTPAGIARGFWEILTSRSLLVTDYLLVGGPGAMLLSGALSGGLALALVLALAVKPNGAIIMALWMTAGFGFFGKNPFNMIPLTLGVLLYAKSRREPFINYTLAALLVATLSPVVSEIAFGFDPLHPWVGLALGVAAGLITGFVFPAVSAFTVRVHDGYDLYNMGFAGGLLALLLVALLKAFGVTIETAALWGGGYDAPMAGLLFALSLLLIAAGLVLGRGRNHRQALARLWRTSGRLVSDYYVLYGETAYLNMGVLGLLSTALLLALGININGPTMGGVLTLVAFGSFGKHPRNVAPVMAGALIAAQVNVLDLHAPMNALALLFSSGLAPIGGQYGPLWGLVAGFLHVTVVSHTGVLSNGLNLYNNGFAAGLVALILIPLIAAFHRPRS